MATFTGVHTVTPSPASPSVGTRLSVYVLATTTDGTRAALAAAGRCASGLGAHIVLLQPHIVPFPADMQDQAAPARVQAEQLRQLAKQLQLDVEIVSALCRSEREVPATLLPRDALVVLGGRSGRWWPPSGKRLAAQLNRAGYRVLFVPTSAP
jgi:hypothetical protein